MKVDYPRSVEIPVRLFGRFTPANLARLAVPPGTIYLLLGNTSSISLLLWTGFGLLLGAGIVYLQWEGQTLDQLAFNIVRWSIEKRNLQGSTIDGVTSDEIRIEDGSALAVIKVHPINLDALTSTEQQAVHEIYADLLNSVNYRIEIHSRQHRFNLEKYISLIENIGKAPKPLREEYIEYCRSASGGELITTQHYITVKAGCIDRSLVSTLLQTGAVASSREVLRSELDSRCHEILDKLNTGFLSAERVTGEELEQISREFDVRNPGTGLTWTHKPRFSHGEYRGTLYVDEFPSQLELGWPVDLLRVDGLIDITQVIEPRDPADTVTRLEQLKTKAVAELNSFAAAGYILNRTGLEDRLEDIDWLLQIFSGSQDLPYQYGVYITVHDTDLENCQKTGEKVESWLRTHRIGYHKTPGRTDQALRGVSPLYQDRLDETVLVPTRSIAASVPFGTQDTNHRSGIIYGLDTAEHTPILVDRFQYDSYNSARFGMTGSGKSYATKLEAIRMWLTYDDLQIVVIDPKDEYISMIQALAEDQADIQFIEDEDYCFDSNIVCFRPRSRGDFENINRLVNLTEEAYTATSQHQKPTLVILDEAHNLLNHGKGRVVLEKWVRESRDTQTGLALISQDTEEFTNRREGRVILRNTKLKVFHYHDNIPENLGAVIEFSKAEKTRLKKLKTGGDGYSQAILKVSGELDTQIRIDATDEEHSLIADEEESDNNTSAEVIKSWDRETPSPCSPSGETASVESTNTSILWNNRLELLKPKHPSAKPLRETRSNFLKAVQLISNLPKNAILLFHTLLQKPVVSPTDLLKESWKWTREQDTSWIEVLLLPISFLLILLSGFALLIDVVIHSANLSNTSLFRQAFLQLCTSGITVFAVTLVFKPLLVLFRWLDTLLHYTGHITIALLLTGCYTVYTNPQTAAELNDLHTLPVLEVSLTPFLSAVLAAGTILAAWVHQRSLTRFRSQSHGFRRSSRL